MWVLWCEVGVHIFSFVWGSLAASARFVEEIVLSPLTRHFCKKSVDHLWVHFWSRNSIPLVCMSSILMPAHCFDYGSFVVSLKLESVSSDFVLQDCFGYSGPLAHFHFLRDIFTNYSAPDHQLLSFSVLNHSFVFWLLLSLRGSQLLIWLFSFDGNLFPLPHPQLF